MSSTTMQSLRRALYEWMGTLSIEEICQNQALIAELARIQKILGSVKT